MKKNNTKILDHVTHWCDECMGDGQISSCCQAMVMDNKCTLCGKFCRTEVCMDCNGEGSITYRVGDPVEIFICVWSPTYLKELLYMPKNFDDRKYFHGKITKIIDDFNVEVHVNYHGLHNIKIDDIDER